MTITHNEQAKHWELFSDEGAKMGELAYMHGGNRELYATHTEVYPAFEGQGYAAKLLQAFADWAAQQGYTIVPVCAYVKQAFRKHPQRYAAVIKKRKPAGRQRKSG